jgi:hypothetical protein
MSLNFFFNDRCPKCRQPKVQAEIVAHPINRHLALQNFHCPDCGPIKTKVISLEPDKTLPKLSA